VQNLDDEIAIYTAAHDPSLGLMSKSGPPAPTGGFPRITHSQFDMELQPGVESAPAVRVIHSAVDYGDRHYLTNFCLGFGRFARERKNRLASRLKSRLVRLTIRQTLASRTPDGKVRAFPVIDAKRHAVRITEVKL
jgi:hypothetical protein